MEDNLPMHRFDELFIAPPSISNSKNLFYSAMHGIIYSLMISIWVLHFCRALKFKSTIFGNIVIVSNISWINIWQVVIPTKTLYSFLLALQLSQILLDLHICHGKFQFIHRILKRVVSSSLVDQNTKEVECGHKAREGSLWSFTLNHEPLILLTSVQFEDVLQLIDYYAKNFADFITTSPVLQKWRGSIWQN